MKKKVIVSTLITLILLIAVGGFIYYRTSVIDTCDVTFKKYQDKTNIACISTSEGIMVFELLPDSGPKSVERFKKLANDNKFYDGLKYYRVVKDFVAQGGLQDLQQQIGITENIEDQALKDKVVQTKDKIETESNMDKAGVPKEEQDKLIQEGYKSNTALNTAPFDFGALSFANAGPDTNSTEIFIVSSKDPKSTNVQYLNGRFTNFGKIIDGQSVLESINNTELDKSGVNPEKPLKEVKILEIRVK